VLFGDADVVQTVREALFEAVEARALGHRRGDRDDALVPLCEPHERVPERVGVRRPLGGRLAVAVREMERAGAVELVGTLLGGLVPFALDRLHVHEHRPGRVDRLADSLAQRPDVVSVDDAEVGEAQLLEEHAGDDERLHGLLEVLAQRVGPLADGGDAGDAALDVFTQLGQRRVETETVEVELQGADVRPDRHLVVVEDDDDGRAHLADVVEGLEGDAAREGAVADHTDDGAFLLARQAGGLGQSEAVADRRRRMARADDVVLGLGATGETRDAAVLADAGEAVAPAGDDLVGVALVADVPDDLVARAVEDAVEGDGEFNGAEARGKVAADLAHAAEDEGADLVRKQSQLEL